MVGSTLKFNNFHDISSTNLAHRLANNNRKQNTAKGFSNLRHVGKMTTVHSKINNLECLNLSLSNINLCDRGTEICVSEAPSLLIDNAQLTQLTIQKPLREINSLVKIDRNGNSLKSTDPTNTEKISAYGGQNPHDSVIRNPKDVEETRTSQNIDVKQHTAVLADWEHFLHSKQQDQEAWSTPRSRSAESVKPDQDVPSESRVCGVSFFSSRMHLSISEQSFPDSNKVSPLTTSPHSSTVGFSSINQDNLNGQTEESRKLSDYQKYLSFANFDPAFKLSEEVLEGSGDYVANLSGVEVRKNLDAHSGSLSSFESADETLLTNIYRRLASSLQSAKSAGKMTRINSIFGVHADGENKGQKESVLAGSDSFPLSKAICSLGKERITSLRTNLKNRDPNKETALWSDHSENRFGDATPSYQDSKNTHNRRQWTSKERLQFHNEFVLRSHLYLSLMLQKRTQAKSISPLNVNASNQFPSRDALSVIHKSVQTSGYDETKMAKHAVQKVALASSKRETQKSQRTKVEISQHSVYDRRCNQVRCRVINKRLRYSSYNMTKKTKMIEGAIKNSVSQIVKNTKIDETYGFHKNPDCQAVSISHRFQSGGKKNQIVLKYESKKYTVYNETKKKTAWSILGKKATHMLSLVYPINVDPRQIMKLRKRGGRSRQL